MTWTKKLTPALFIALAASGCAHTVPKELSDARAAYQRVSQGTPAELARADVQEARIALAHAEQAYAKFGNARDTRDLAYIALRRAQIAEVHARGTALARESPNVRVYGEDGKYGLGTPVPSASQQTLSAAQKSAEENQAALDEARARHQEQETHHANVTSSVEE